MVEPAATGLGLDLTPLDRYEPSRAKVCANVRWLLHKVREPISEELRDPLYTDQCGEQQLKPVLSHLLLSRPPYARAAQGRQAGDPGDTASLLQLLNKKGISVRTEQGAVTETELSQTPLALKAHLALVDALMALAAQDTLEQVQMSTEAEVGVGAPWENALLFWVNKINQTLRECTVEEEQVPRSQNCTDIQPATDPNQSNRWYWKLVPIRYRKDKVQSKLTPTFPLVSGLKDLSNGCALAAVLHYYCPELLPLEDVCLKDTMSVADSVYNLELIRAFCNTHLQQCCPLQVEDLLYTPPLLHTNILAFLAELMDCFEVRKPDFVKPLHPVDLTDVSGVLDSTSPVGCHTNNSPSYIFKQPFVPVPSELSAENQSWTKKQISGPLSAVAFSIPFGLDSDVDIVMGNPIDCVFGPVSSASRDIPAPAYSPPEDLSHLMSNSAPAPRSWGPYSTPMGELPTIEEALQPQVSHPRKMRPESRLRPEGAPAGFYLHFPEKEGPTLSSSVPSRRAGGDRPRDRSRSSDMSRDDDSVLRDGSVDSSEASDDTPRDAPGNMRPNWGGPNNGYSPIGSPHMTSFAARRDSSRRRQPAAPGEETSSAPRTPTAHGPDAQALGARLEEKRKSIEAQKRRIEAIFAKHRQRLGKNAFLQLQREQGEGGDTVAGDAKEQLSLDERLTQVEEQLQRDEDKEQKEQVSAPPPRLEKQVTFSLDNKELKGVAGSPGPGVQQYTEVVQKLSEALECLQKDMQKLTQQQQQLLSGQRHNHSSKIKPAPINPKTPPRTPSKTPVRSKALLIPVSGQLASTKSTLLSSSCPAPRTRTVPRSPKTTSRTPTRPRPSDLAFPPLTRVLTPPQSVDSLPHLRRVSPSKCQVQTSSSFRIGGPRTPPQTHPPASAQSEESTSDTGSSETPTQFSLELEDRDSGPVYNGLVQDRPAQDLPGPVETSPSECSLQSDTLSLSAFSTGGDGCPGRDRCSLMASLSSLGPAEGGVEEGASDEQTEFSSDSMSDLTDVTRTRESSLSASDVRVQEPTLTLPQPIENSQQASPKNHCGADGPPQSDTLTVDGPPQSDTFTADGPAQSDASSSDRSEEPRGAIGLFYMDGAHREEDMAQRRATLLERQQRRSEEMRRRRQWSEQESDTRLGGPDQRAASPSRSPAGLPSASSTPPATPSRRGDFTRGEYARRHQLRIMDDLDKVLKQKPASGARGKKTRARPRSVTRESTRLSLSPAKSTSAGPRLTKVYSHSSLNLPSTADCENSSSDAKKLQSRSSSPCAQGADTEAGSSSGPSSATDYTGPKLFKEPSFKSNKFIIHNALARCCLAGRVNESQKNKIVEEMEKSEAHHFLILFRDASCQFRGVYTLSPDAQELVRLTGVGPRAVPRGHIQSIYKYSSDRKQFCPIPSKTLGMSVDAFTIPGALWHGGGAGGGANRRASITKKSPAK